MSELVVFLIGTVALGLAASGSFGFSPFVMSGQTEIHEVTTAQLHGAVAYTNLKLAVSTGNIRLTFTNNATLIYRVVFTKYFSFFYQPEVNFNFALDPAKEELNVTATSTTASADITLNQNIRSKIQLTTSTGNIRLEAPPTTAQVEKLDLTTSTGNIGVNITNTSRLQELVATTSTGQVEAHIKSSLQTQDANARLNTATGQVTLDLNIINIESDIKASTTIGRVNANQIIGFTVLSQTTTSLHAQTQNYAASGLGKLNISASTTTGNVDISAVHS